MRIGIGIAEETVQERLFMEPGFDQIRLLTLAEAAQLLHVSTRTLQRMVRSSDLPVFKVGGQWRLRESQLTEWIERREGQTVRTGR